MGSGAAYHLGETSAGDDESCVYEAIEETS
jgi:hypothetical protein